VAIEQNNQIPSAWAEVAVKKRWESRLFNIMGVMVQKVN